MSGLILASGWLPPEGGMTAAYVVAWPLDVKLPPKVTPEKARAACAGYGLVVATATLINTESPMTVAMSRCLEDVARRGRVTELNPQMPAAPASPHEVAALTLASDAFGGLYTAHGPRNPTSEN